MTDQLRTCTSKVVHLTASAAWRVLAKSPYRKIQNVYRCPYCHRWHIGTKNSQRMT